MLRLAEDLKLPLDVVTQTIAILAKRRAGKSYTMRRLTEQLHDAGQQIVLVDPKGDQWGIRSAADGKAPGLPVVILGGERADVPLEANSGEIVAKLVVEERVSVVLDLSLFRKHEVATFMTGFLENLYRLKAREQYRTPMMLVIDEADAVAPQKPQKGEERMLGAAEDIVRRGGQRGIGCTLVTQRSAVLNKNVLTQAQILVVLRTIAPQDLVAMKAWIDVHGTDDEGAELMDSLPSLPVGDAWFWSPGWPTAKGIFKRVHVLPIETFDSGATPKPGEKRQDPKTVADVDLDALKRQMSATIEKAKADDPRELKKQLSTLKAELAAKDRVIAEVDLRTKRIDEKLSKVQATKREEARAGKIAEVQQQLARHRRALEEAVKILVRVKAVDFALDSEEQRKALEQAVAGAIRQVTAPLEKRVTALTERVEGIRQQAGAAEKAIKALLDEQIDLTVHVQKREPFMVVTAPSRPPSSSRAVRAIAAADALPTGVAPKTMHRAMLTVLAQVNSGGLTKRQIRVRTGYRDSGPVSSAFAELLREGWAVADANRLVISRQGLEALGQFDPLPRGQELRQQLIAGQVGKLNQMERKFLALLCQSYPHAMTKAALREGAGYADSGPVSSAFGHLVALDYAVQPSKGELKASDELFEEA